MNQPTSHVFPRHNRKSFPVAVRGEGAYLFDASGKSYLDGSGGAAVSCLGHGDAHVIEAVRAQIGEMAFAHTGFLSSEPAELLANRLIDVAPGNLDRVYIVSGGSEAMEAALKLARQYYIEKGEPARARIISRRQSYHGNTLGALAVGGNEWRRKPFKPLLMEVSHVSPCYAYREQPDDMSTADYVAHLMREIEGEIDAWGAESIMAVVAEPVVGATLGAVPPVDGYFRALRDLCDRHGILLILDEVMCGMGRTGTLFACEQDGVAPDIVAIAKGLGAGYQPIGAMLCTADIYGVIGSGSGFFQHGHTYLGHATACAAANAVFDRLLGDDLVSRVAPMGDLLRDALEARFGQHPHVGDIRGRGLFQGLEFVANRETKEPLDPTLKTHARIKSAAFDAGLICYPMGGTVDGQRGDHVLLAPPFILTEDQIGELVDKLDTAVTAALA